MPWLVIVVVACALLLSACLSLGGSTNAFITVWKTDNPGESADNQITLPLVEAGSYNFIVEWGDGTRDRISAWDDPASTHSYSSPGTYTVTITGTITGWQFAIINYLRFGDSRKLLIVENWGPLAFGPTEEGQFAGAANMVITASDAPDLSQTTSLRSAFLAAESLTNEDFSAWDTSSITDMRALFIGARAFHGDISTWDTSAVTDMSFVFASADAFNGNISQWDTSAVTNMRSMFHPAPAFDGDVSAWDTSSVTDMTWMFRGASAYTNGGNPSGLEHWTIRPDVMTEDMFFDSAMEGQEPSWYRP